MRGVCVLLFLAMAATPAQAQSLYMKKGERAVEGSIGWSVGPSSNGTEGVVSASVDGRVDVGVSLARYTYTFTDGSKSTFTEYAPFVRFFPIKEQDGAPVSLAISGQVFLDSYGTPDSGHYVQVGTAIYKQLKLSDRLSIQPYVGFAFVAESYTFGGGPAARAQYLTRDIGLHFTSAPERPWIFRLTLAEQSFRRETYRGARVSVIHRL
ncbi:MAG TPA: hypothetical protein VF921_15815 [Vicinamibacterales bacterium]